MTAWLLGAACVGTAQAALDRATLVTLAPSVLKVEVVRADGSYSLGSGIVVAPERVVTNCHVTRDARRISVVRGGVRLPVQSQSSDAYHDLCVLQVAGVPGRPVRLGDSAGLVIGQSVTALGYTGGSEIQTSPGKVIVLHRMDGAQVIQSSNFFSSGASGGGLFDDELRLVGILTFRLRGGTAHYFAMPIEWLGAALSKGMHDEPISPLGANKLAFWEQPADLQPLFLRAASLEREGNWAALQPLASDWARSVADDPEPWYLLGVALDAQARTTEARRALECSLAVAPDFKPARALLAPIYRREGLAVATAAPSAPCQL
jgi:serine protease Do